ncbi:pectin lyase precursor [Fusarium pseudocircinatum]|uniref:pectin lyase n=1 Tax=Fusarium pseudocircinatum TaxID=56676 RepID=A0A8H5PQZ0_9HYPO|nr:pectin lyase precursor [Fusarium pseudocircinatum]
MAESKPVIAIVPGGFCSPEVYQPVANILEQDGFTVIIPRLTVTKTLTSKDPTSTEFKDLSNKGLLDDVKEIHDRLASELEKGSEVVIFGHSYGSLPGLLAIEGHTVAERKAKGLSGGIKGYVAVAGMGSSTCDAAKPLFFSDLPPERRDEAWKLVLGSQSQKSLSDVSDFINSDATIPKTYVLCEKDQTVPPELQEMLIQAGGFDKVEKLSSGHFPFVSQFLRRIIRQNRVSLYYNSDDGFTQDETGSPVYLLASSTIAIMKFTLYFSALTALLTPITAQKLSGSAQGFAQGVTGGGSAAAVTPKNIQELVTYLTDKTPRVIVLDRTYDFIGSEGTVKEKGCAPWKTGAGCQLAINAAGNWCGDNPKVDVTYSKAGTSGINVASDKTIIGVGNKGIIKGKGLRFVNVKNIIVQNIHITNLNPQYVWGGDAFTFSGTSKIWIDHCTTSLLGRQHYVFGRDKSTGITLSNNHIDGRTQWSAGCDGYHYWTIEMVGQGDQITLQNNLIEHTAGRGPALSATTFLHAVNNVWRDINGHAIEGDTAGKGLFEGNVFQNVKQVVVPDFKGQLNSCPDNAAASATQQYLGRVCQGNIFISSGAFNRKDTGFMSDFKGLPIARSTQATTAQSKVPGNAGFGKI